MLTSSSPTPGGAPRPATLAKLTYPGTSLQACDAARRSKCGGMTGPCGFAFEKVERILGFCERGEGVAHGEGDFFVGVENDGEDGRGVVIHGELSLCDRGDRGDFCVCTQVTDDCEYLCPLLCFEDKDGRKGSTSGAVTCVFSDACEFEYELERANEGGEADEDSSSGDLFIRRCSSRIPRCSTRSSLVLRTAS